MKRLRCLIACEFSGITRDAFIARGHDAISCDLLPTEQPGPHIQGDVIEELKRPYDLVICHPPCTYLSYAGTAHWNKPGRAEKREEAMAFFMMCWNANAPRVCVENPFGLPCQRFRPASQIINPFDFGEPIRKRTCLWLRGLPILTRGDWLWPREQQPVPPPEPVYVNEKSGKRGYGQHETPAKNPRRWHWAEAMSSANGADRQRERSRSFVSIARAMAEQWSDALTPPPVTARAARRGD